MERREHNTWVTCRMGNHYVPRNQIAVHYEPGFGLCHQCIIRRCNRVADYWMRGRAVGPAEQIEQV